MKRHTFSKRQSEFYFPYVADKMKSVIFEVNRDLKPTDPQQFDHSYEGMELHLTDKDDVFSDRVLYMRTANPRQTC